jgi:hypothetical protein
VARAGGEHQRGLEVIVQGGEVGLVAQRDEQLDNGEVAEGGGEVEVRVGQPAGGSVWVVEEFGVRVEDALDEEGIVGVNCPA